MLWQAAQGMRFGLAGAALKTPDVGGGPVGSGNPGSARRILTDLTLLGAPEPKGTAAQLTTVRPALAAWQVDQVVIAGASRDPVYASGFLTMALGMAPVVQQRRLGLDAPSGWAATTPAVGASLSSCRGFAALRRRARTSRSRCPAVSCFGAGRA